MRVPLEFPLQGRKLFDFCCIPQTKLLNNETVSFKSDDGRSLSDEMKQVLKSCWIENKNPLKKLNLKPKVPVSPVHTSLLSQLRGESYPQFEFDLVTQQIYKSGAKKYQRVKDTKILKKGRKEEKRVSELCEMRA